MGDSISTSIGLDGVAGATGVGGAPAGVGGAPVGVGGADSHFGRLWANSSAYCRTSCSGNRFGPDPKFTNLKQTAEVTSEDARAERTGKQKGGACFIRGGHTGAFNF